MARTSTIPHLIEDWIREENPNLFRFNNTILFKAFKSWCEMKQISPPSYPSFNSTVREIKESRGKDIDDKGIYISKAPQVPPKESLAEKEVNIEVNVDLIANGHSNGFILSGPTGIGKTTAVVSRLEECDLTYLYYAGSISNALEFYKFFYEHKDGEIIVIDDTKGVIGRDAVCADIVSAALDDNHLTNNVVSYLHKDLDSPEFIESLKEQIEEAEELIEEAEEDEKLAREDERLAREAKNEEAELTAKQLLNKALSKKNKANSTRRRLQKRLNKAIPNRFSVTSGVIFLTNTPMDKIDKAIGSRCLPLDYWLNKDEILEKIKNSIQEIYPDNALSHKKEVLKLFREEKEQMKRFDIRTFKKSCIYRFANKELVNRGTDWIKMTRKLVNSGT